MPHCRHVLCFFFQRQRYGGWSSTESASSKAAHRTVLPAKLDRRPRKHSCNFFVMKISCWTYLERCKIWAGRDVQLSVASFRTVDPCQIDDWLREDKHRALGRWCCWGTWCPVLLFPMDPWRSSDLYSEAMGGIVKCIMQCQELKLNDPQRLGQTEASCAYDEHNLKKWER